METDAIPVEKTIAGIAVKYPSAVTVFTRLGLDFCCGGKRSFEKACREAGLEPDEVMNEIKHTSTALNTSSIRFDTWATSLLIEFIVQHHHAYVRNIIPVLEGLLEKLVGRHAQQHPELIEVQTMGSSLFAELYSHMEKEENVLFPNIGNPAFNAEMPIEVMEHEHEQAGERIKKIRALTNHYTPPPYACITWQTTWQRLQEFDNDLMQHIHLENNILFPRVRKPSGIA
jgi:regulator of cell morphogenesis and NO signaling